MSVYEGAFYLTGTGLIALGVGYEHGVGAGLVAVGAMLVFVAIIGEWPADE